MLTALRESREVSTHSNADFQFSIVYATFGGKHRMPRSV